MAQQTDHIGDTNKMVTAVDWLQEQLNPDMKTMQGNIMQDLLEQAKQMEKEQIIDAHIEGQRVFDKHPHTQWTNNQAEQYYNETYKSDTR